ncbi:LysR family transcriptional regulator [Nisaea acidiphila]|uniref:LysR family transcriptional regulator n=1 Tax=Nisaea acidiphila TaxID=1862145 RepID=A0A9J7AX31_9PROT|nr:LysR family transcriptional regulator [Nisaea acidiphila]UUX50993.1 LysR family transcriptional regulator [Nisaea acidiphila]
MDRLSALNSFVRACENGSFSAAARELGLTQPAVSQQIRALEQHLGVRLFDRTTRKVLPTEEGLRYLDRARDILERLDAADRSVSGIDVAMTGRLAVGAPVGFGSDILAPYFAAFKRDYPELLLEVSLTDRFVDVIEERLDVVIRMGHLEDDRLIVRRLGEIGRSLAASAHYLNRRGRPKHPSELPMHDYLLYTHIRSGEMVTLEGPDGQLFETRVRPVLSADHKSVLHHALLSGLGICLVHTPFLRQMIANGGIEHVLPEWRYPRQNVHVVYPSNRFVPQKVRRFVDGLTRFLKEQNILENASPELSAAE